MLGTAELAAPPCVVQSGDGGSKLSSGLGSRDRRIRILRKAKAAPPSPKKKEKGFRSTERRVGRVGKREGGRD